MKLLLLNFLSIFVLVSCISPYQNHVPTVLNFPLVGVEIFSSDDVIKRIAVANTWVVAYASGTATAIDIETKNILWKSDLRILADDPLGFLIVDDVLVATSANQVVLIDKMGHQKKLISESPEKDIDDILRVAAVHPGNLYINRFDGWELEAYSMSQNAKMWGLDVGRGSTDVFYDSVTNIAYITTRYESFFAVDNTTGKVLWKHGESTLVTTYKDGIIYAVSLGSNSHKIRFSAFDVKTQSEVWNSEVAFSKLVYELTIIDDLLIVSGDEGLIAVNKSDGVLVWQTAEGESFATKPVKFDDIIYAKGSSHTVYAISSHNGEYIGHVSLESNKSVQPMYEVVSGVYKAENSIVFNTRNDI